MHEVQRCHRMRARDVQGIKRHILHRREKYEYEFHIICDFPNIRIHWTKEP